MQVVLQSMAAEFMLVAFLYIGDALARRFFNPSKASVRWSVAILVALYVATIAFHLLAAAQQFRLLHDPVRGGIETEAVAIGTQRGLAAEGQGEPGFFRPLLGVGKALAQQRRRRSAPQPLAARQIRNQWGDEYRGGHGFGNYLTVAQGTHAGIGSSPNRVSA